MREVYKKEMGKREKIDYLIEQYESAMDQIDDLKREAKDRIWVKDVFGHGRTLLLDVKTIIISVVTVTTTY